MQQQQKGEECEAMRKDQVGTRAGSGKIITSVQEDTIVIVGTRRYNHHHHHCRHDTIITVPTKTTITVATTTVIDCMATMIVYLEMTKIFRSAGPINSCIHQIRQAALQNHLKVLGS